MDLLRGTQFLSAKDFEAKPTTHYQTLDWYNFAERYADYVCAYEKANS